MERDQGGANKDWNDDIEPDLSENDCDKGYDSKNPDDESLVEGEAEDDEGFMREKKRKSQATKMRRKMMREKGW